MVWADIALKHPEAIAQLPKEIVFIDWNYGWDLNRFGNLDNLLKAGYEVWGAPAIRSGADNFYLSQWPLHFNNLRDFIPAARRLGYSGMVLTSWSTNGIFNPVFQNAADIIENYPRGHRYPITGYNMLLEAFFKSLQSDAPLEIEGFIKDYCREKFALDAGQSLELWQALRMGGFEIIQGRVLSPTPVTVGQVLDSALLAGRILQRLSPAKGQKEFAHFVLMNDIRVQYLETYLVESILNETTPTAAEYKGFAVRLKKIMDRSPDLDRRFIDINKDSFYLGDLQNENRIRSFHLQALYDRVSHNRG